MMTLQHFRSKYLSKMNIKMLIEDCTLFFWVIKIHLKIVQTQLFCCSR